MIPVTIPLPASVKASVTVYVRDAVDVFCWLNTFTIDTNPEETPLAGMVLWLLKMDVIVPPADAEAVLDHPSLELESPLHCTVIQPGILASRPVIVAGIEPLYVAIGNTKIVDDDNFGTYAEVVTDTVVVAGFPLVMLVFAA